MGAALDDIWADAEIVLVPERLLGGVDERLVQVQDQEDWGRPAACVPAARWFSADRPARQRS